MNIVCNFTKEKVFPTAEYYSNYNTKMSLKKNISSGVRLNMKILAATNVESLIQIVIENKNELNNVNVTTAIHRIAKICHRRPYKIKKAYTKITPLINQLKEKCITFTGRQLANTAWGLSILQYKEKNFLSTIAEESIKRLFEFEPQHLAILVWSFATLNIRNEKLFEKVSFKSMERIDEFNPQNLSNLAWSYSKMEDYKQELFDKIAMCACRTLKDFAPQNISNLIWSYANLRIKNMDLFETIVNESINRLEEFNTQNISNLSWSFAYLSPKSKFNSLLFGEIASVSLIKMEYFNEKYLSNLAWAFVVVEYYPKTLLSEAFTILNKIDRTFIESLDTKFKSQWYQVDLAMKLQMPFFSKSVFIEATSRKIFAKDFLREEIKKCEVNLEISNLLNSLNISHKNNFRTSSGYYVSHNLNIGKEKIAIQYDGKSMFIKDSKEPVGEVVLKKRLLTLMNWKVISIPFYEFEEIKTGCEKKIYIIQKLMSNNINVSLLEDGKAEEKLIEKFDNKKENILEDINESIKNLKIGTSNVINEKFEWRGNSILEGIKYKSHEIQYMNVRLNDVVLTKPLGGKFLVNQRFELVELDLLESLAKYKLNKYDTRFVYIHPIRMMNF